MGICLDTEQNNEDLETGERSRRESTWPSSPAGAGFPMQNTSHVKFEPPNVPVIFVLGGPGSGKVTHCDNFMQERRGLVHINMTDLLQQYAIGNDMQDFGTLSSKTVTEVLMLEMKMAPAAKTYLVSGYPRSMRDVAEYSDKIQTISGVILVSWRQRVLERQIEYGARLGHVVLSLARMELNNFYKNVMPVADYFDQSNVLIAVNGERNPEEVYRDFRAAVLQILSAVEDDDMNGVGNGGIPGEIVGVEPAPTRHRPDSLNAHDLDDDMPATIVPRPAQMPNGQALLNGQTMPSGQAILNGQTMLNGQAMPNSQIMPSGQVMSDHGVREQDMPTMPMPKVMPVNGVNNANPKAEVIRVRGTATKVPTVWVVGGPGSNKAVLCERAVSQKEGWMHFSLGQKLRALADAGGGPASDGALSRAAVSGGELVPKDLVFKLVRNVVADAARSGQGLVLDGCPRDLEQMTWYQNEYKTEPRMVLVDCSKLQLGRGRRDDAVGAFRRRLELFRELSLPMLKHLDHQHRLVIVDGDTDLEEVRTEFTRILLEEMEKSEIIAQIPNSEAQNGTSTMQQFTHSMSRLGAGFANGVPHLPHNGAQNGVPNGVANGFINLGNNKVKPMVSTMSRIPTVSQMTHDDVRRLYEQSNGEISMNTHI
ncbi:uncharacterized protein LOC123706481 [Colias croceus]|uniref:uncharacterized protein LOC123706481 n=1 Tax=Colias crocea TaxID=72248 RepID=UPI001E28112F|nr:uncharacterized protein LOC123706481 [Colias croceus]